MLNLQNDRSDSTFSGRFISSRDTFAQNINDIILRMTASKSRDCLLLFNNLPSTKLNAEGNYV